MIVIMNEIYKDIVILYHVYWKLHQLRNLIFCNISFWQVTTLRSYHQLEIMPFNGNALTYLYLSYLFHFPSGLVPKPKSQVAQEGKDVWPRESHSKPTGIPIWPHDDSKDHPPRRHSRGCCCGTTNIHPPPFTGTFSPSASKRNPHDPTHGYAALFTAWYVSSHYPTSTTESIREWSRGSPKFHAAEIISSNASPDSPYSSSNCITAHEK